MSQAPTLTKRKRPERSVVITTPITNAITSPITVLPVAHTKLPTLHEQASETEPIVPSTVAVAPPSVTLTEPTAIQQASTIDANTQASSSTTLHTPSSSNVRATQPKKRRATRPRVTSPFPHQKALLAYASEALAPFAGCMRWNGKLDRQAITPKPNDDQTMTQYLPFAHMLNPRAAIWFGAIPWQILTPIMLYIMILLLTIATFCGLTGWHKPMSGLWLMFTVCRLHATILNPHDMFDRYVDGRRNLLANLGIIDVARVVIGARYLLALYDHSYILGLSFVLVLWQISAQMRHKYKVGATHDDTQDDQPQPAHRSLFTIPSTQTIISDIAFIPNLAIFIDYTYCYVYSDTYHGITMPHVASFIVASQYIMVYILVNRWMLMVEARALLVNLSLPPTSPTTQQCLPSHLRANSKEPSAHHKYQRTLEAWIHHHLDLIAIPQLAHLQFPPAIMARLHRLPTSERKSVLQYISARHVETGKVDLDFILRVHLPAPPQNEDDQDDVAVGLLATDYVPDIAKTIIQRHQNPLLCTPTKVNVEYPWPIDQPINLVNPNPQNAIVNRGGHIKKASDIYFYGLLDEGIRTFMRHYRAYLHVAKWLDIDPSILPSKLSIHDHHQGENHRARPTGAPAHQKAQVKLDAVENIVSQLSAMGLAGYIRFADANVPMVSQLLTSMMPSISGVGEVVQMLFQVSFNMPLINLWAHQDLPNIFSPAEYLSTDLYAAHAQGM